MDNLIRVVPYKKVGKGSFTQAGFESFGCCRQLRFSRENKFYALQTFASIASLIYVRDVRKKVEGRVST